MKQKLLLMSVVFSMVFAIAVGQTAISTVSVGSGAGSLSVDSFNSWGFIDGDNATFDNGTDTAATTIWNLCWMVYDVDADASYYLDEGFTAAEHTNNRVTDGTVDQSGLPASFSNTGIGFPNSANLSADLVVTASAPDAGNTARLAWSWTFDDTSGTTRNLRLIWFVDVDSYIDTNDYQDDFAAFTTSANHSGLAIAMGNSGGSDDVDLNTGVLVDANTAPARSYGISDSLGSSFYWSAQNTWATDGPEIVKQIDDALWDTVQNDADNNGVSDTGNDAGAAMQFDIAVPSNSSSSLECYLTWGDDSTVSGFPAGEKRWLHY